MTTTCALGLPSPSRLRDLVHSIEQAALAEAPADLWQYARKETFQQEFGRERRRDRRYSLITNVDRRSRRWEMPTGGRAVCGPVERHVGERNSPDPHLPRAVRIAVFGDRPRVGRNILLSVLRSRPVGPCFEIAGQLVKVDAKEPSRPPIRVTTVAEPVICVAERGGIESSLAPTTEELAQWAAVSAAIETLKARS